MMTWKSTERRRRPVQITWLYVRPTWLESSWIQSGCTAAGLRTVCQYVRYLSGSKWTHSHHMVCHHHLHHHRGCRMCFWIRRVAARFHLGCLSVDRHAAASVGVVSLFGSVQIHHILDWVYLSSGLLRTGSDCHFQIGSLPGGCLVLAGFPCVCFRSGPEF